MNKKQTIGQAPGAVRSNRKVFAWIGLGIVVLLAIVFLGIVALAANQVTLPKRVFDPDLNPRRYNLEYEEIRYPARIDGLQIAAWYIPSEENQRAIILVHGRDNSRTNGFVDQFVSFAKVLHESGFSILMIDLRGHGESDDARYTFGIKERRDILGGVDWLEARGYQPGKIGVLGYSLGAASVIGAAAEEEDIGVIWIDSAYADVKPVIEEAWEVDTGLPQILLNPIRWMARLLYGIDITASRPVDEIGKIAPRPIFMAHCKEDKLIPISNLDQLLAIVQNTQTWVIQNCDQKTLGNDIVPEKYNNHALGYNLQPREYEQKVIQFFSANLK